MVGPHLAQVVEVRRRQDRVALRGGEPHPLADLAGEACHVAGVPPEVGPVVLREADERVEGLEVSLRRDHAPAAHRPLGGDVLRERVRRQGTLAVVGLRQVPGDLLVAQQVPLVDVEHRGELLVGRPVQHGEGVDVAPVGLGDRRLHRRRTRHEGAHLLQPRGELDLPQRLQVVRIRRHHRQHPVLRVVEHREHLVLLRVAPRHLVQRQPVDVRLGQLLRADEARLVHRRDELQQIVLRDGPYLEERLLDAPSHPVELRERRLVLSLVDLPCLQQEISEPVERRGAGGCRHILPSIPQTSPPGGAPATTTSFNPAPAATGAASGRRSSSDPAAPRARCPPASRSSPSPAPSGGGRTPAGCSPRPCLSPRSAGRSS